LIGWDLLRQFGQHGGVANPASGHSMARLLERFSTELNRKGIPPGRDF
jgi:hypothetical protein